MKKYKKKFLIYFGTTMLFLSMAFLVSFKAKAATEGGQYIITTIAGNGTAGYTGDGGGSNKCSINYASWSSSR